jgi:hypothetical protein
MRPAIVSRLESTTFMNGMINTNAMLFTSIRAVGCDEPSLCHITIASTFQRQARARLTLSAFLTRSRHKTSSRCDYREYGTLFS